MIVCLLLGLVVSGGCFRSQKDPPTENSAARSPGNGPGGRPGSAGSSPAESPASPATESGSQASIPTAARADRPVVVFLGDSLTAGFGLAEDQAFPARVAERLADSGLEIRAVNAGVSGDTSAGGLRRLDWLLRQEPDLIVVGLGANDGLRGQPPEATEANLREIVETLQAADVEVLLLGMKIPPSYGASYFERFEEIYPRLAERYQVDLVPFLLEGVAAQPELNLADGIHPNAEGHRRVAATVAPFVESILNRVQAR